MKFVFLSYVVTDQNQIAAWIPELVSRTEGDLIFYDPWRTVAEQLASPLFMETLSRSSCAPRAAEHCDALKLDADLFKDPVSVGQRLQMSDTATTIDFAFKDLYVLLRCDLMLVDFSTPAQGSRSQEAMYAHLANIPIIGISSRFILHPWFMNVAKVIVKPDVSEIITQIDLIPKRAWASSAPTD